MPTDEGRYLAEILAKGAGISALYHVLGEPDVILKFIPLYNAQSIEITKSHQKLKYRAIGGQFLAHQRGGNYALRIDVKLPDTDDYLNFGSDFPVKFSSLDIITLLQILHAQGDAMKLDNMKDAVLPSSFSPDPTKISMNRLTLKNAIMDGEVNVKGEYTDVITNWHKTFTIITKDEILFNMYIESLIYWRTNNKDDPNTINLSILCRKFVEPPKITEFEEVYIDKVKVTEKKSIIRDQFGTDGLVKDIHYTIDGQTVQSTDVGYYVNVVDRNFDSTKVARANVLKALSETRIPNNYEELELLANTIYRATTIVVGQRITTNTKYRQLVLKSLGAGVIKSANVIETVIDIKSGNTEDLDFSYYKEIDSVLLKPNDKRIGINNLFYFEPSFTEDTVRVKIIYANPNIVSEFIEPSGYKTFYIIQESYYSLELGGDKYLFYVYPTDYGCRIRVWIDESE
jgi:hypothetical protein